MITKGKILRSNHVSRDDKVEEVLKKMTKLGFTFGAVFSTSIIGQIIIPIPILGAVIGGIVGGIFSTIVGQVVDSTNTYPAMPYTVFIAALKHFRKEDGSWSFDAVDPIKHILARWHSLCRTRRVSDDTWLTVICFINLSVYHSVLISDDDMPDEIKEKTEELNKFIEPTVTYLESRMNILEFDKKLLNIVKTLSVLVKESFIKMDVKMQKAKKHPQQPVAQ